MEDNQAAKRQETNRSGSHRFEPEMNALSQARSPYLRQHADNPVHWQEWSDAAFEYARQRDLPVFVSVGYSTCHWCHVMAAGAFSDPACAEMLNSNFVSIKVDREERPDIDSYLMSFLVETTGQGGWPLNAFLSPKKEIFFAMTYAPAPSERAATRMMSFEKVLARIDSFYREKKGELAVYEPRRTSALGPGAVRSETSLDLDALELPDLEIEPSISAIFQAFDGEWGGFAGGSGGPGGGPKFPPHSTLLWMLHAYAATGDSRLEEMSKKTLDAMAERGLHDHLQGGFFRYCTDRAWTIPHFEKMLYDQALLLWNYAAAAHTFSEPRYAAVAESIVRCLEESFRESVHGGSGTLYVSAHDADTNHEEGVTYLWSREEIDALLDGDTRAAFEATFELPAEGNFESRIHLIRAPREPGEKGASSDHDKSLRTACERLLEQRKARQQPFVDRKTHTGWNALAAIALVEAGRLLERPEWSARGKEIAGELIARHDDGSTLVHASLDGEAGSSEFLGDYAALVLLCTLLAEEDSGWLARAKDFAGRLSRFRQATDAAEGDSPDRGAEGATVWLESFHDDFRPVAADVSDLPIPGSISLADYGLARLAMITRGGWDSTAPLPPLACDFWNLSVLARGGFFYLVESNAPPTRSALPLNSIRIPGDPGQPDRYCFAGSCRTGLPDAP